MTCLITLLFFIIATTVLAIHVDDRRIVAMGDLHGDLANTLSILKFSKIIDDDQRWIAGNTILVQTVRLLFLQLNNC